MVGLTSLPRCEHYELPIATWELMAREYEIYLIKKLKFLGGGMHNGNGSFCLFARCSAI